MELLIGIVIGIALTAVFLRGTRGVKPGTPTADAVRRARSIIAGGGGPDPTEP